jgi:excisionase family DNA binding protein
MKHALYSPEQVALKLGLHVRTVRNYVRQGRLRAVRIGKQYRIASKDLAQLTGEPQLEFEPQESASQPHSEVSSIVDIGSISPEMANRITNLLMAAGNSKGRTPGSRAETIYDPQRMRMKIILVGTMQDNAAFFNLISGVIES